MSIGIPILAEATSPILIEKLILGDNPGFIWHAIYGVAVVVAPVVGPTLGGWITDTYSWHWVFLINVPMGLLSLFLVGTLVSEPSGAEEEREKLLRNGIQIDYIGFVLVAIGLGSLEFVLDEGQRKDWFGSNMILGFALENLAKGIIVCRDPKRVGGAHLEDWRRKGHKLAELFDWAGIPVTDAEREVLNRTARLIAWKGRYPVPMNFDEMTLQDPVIGYLAVTNIWPADEYRQLSVLYDKAKAALIQVMQEVPPLTIDHDFADSSGSKTVADDLRKT